jgi:hypothetical protein
LRLSLLMIVRLLIKKIKKVILYEGIFGA